ncbi:plexus [Elysia marginata]|uniref:Plexus n=1 Tax=Elysia marginata TaxID=1093978 RepID=A0AAV4GBP4_9GAST|nr:plexus [Elysia marginata]
MPSRVVCFVCGSLGGDYGQLHSRPPQGRKGEKIGFDGMKSAYFPFLEHHDPPQGCRPPDAGGLVDSCRVCHAFLTQQWANYERSNTPAVKRLYWLKRLDDGQFTGAEMKLQGEYMAQVMGLQYQPSSDGGGGIPPQALSPDSRDGFKGDTGRTVPRDSDIPPQGKKRAMSNNSVHYNGGGGDVLDLSVSVKTEPSIAKQSRKLSKDSFMENKSYDQGSVEKNHRDSHPLRSQPREPELDEYMFVCYTCGKESSGVAAKFVSSRVHAPGEPHFPFLARLVPCEGASPMTAQGVCRVCDLCFSSMCHQWLAYEQHGTPSSARIFRLNNLFFSNDASLSMSGTPVGGSQREHNDSHTQNRDKEKSTSSKKGINEDFNHRPGSDQRVDMDYSHHKSLTEVCYLCSQLRSSLEMCPLYTMPATSSREDSHSYFPFIRELRRPQGARPLNPDGSVRVCISCNSNLQAQWLQYQSDRTPHSKRRYSLLPTSSSTAPLQQPPNVERVRSPEHSRLSSKHLEKSDCDSKVSVTQPLHLDIGKEDLKTTESFSKYSASGLNPTHRVAAVPHYANQQNTPGSVSNTALAVANSELHHAATLPLSSTSSSLNTIPHPLQQAGERPKKVCFLCGEKCLSTKSQVLYAYPARHEVKTAVGSHVSPFFPFISSREPAPNSEPMAEDGGIITCAYCYYSLINQWRDYEEGSKRVQLAENAGESPSDNRWQRKYSLSEFSCFVCGSVDVPRRSMRTLEVRKYGFLREHRAPPQALVMGGGESVGCCSLCHYSLTHQLAEYERLGLPPELRKYNWTVQQPGGQHHHHLDENSCDTQDSTQDSHGHSTGPAELTVNTGSEAEDSNQGE